MTTGERLRAARQERNISLDDVARRTNIRPVFLTAIDDDNLSEIPASHRRLFVREYARAIGVDPQEVLVDLPEVSPAIVAPEAMVEEVPTYHSVEAETDRRQYREILRGLSKRSAMSSMTSNPAWMLIGFATILLLGVALYYFITAGESSATQTKATAPTDTAAAQAEILSAPEGTAEIKPVVLEPGDSLTLEGRASAKVWYTIVMDGKRSETGTLDSGMSKTWRASELFKVSLGNAGGLQLLLNDQTIGTLGPAKSAVRGKYIDAMGLRTGSRPNAPSKTSPPSPAATATAPTPTGTAAAPAGTTVAPARAAAPRDKRPSSRRTPRRQRTTTTIREISPTNLR